MGSGVLKQWEEGSEDQDLGPEEGGPPGGEVVPAASPSLPSIHPPPLSTGNISSILRVRGCTAQAGCNLLNGTQKIGPIEMSEDCSPRVSMNSEYLVAVSISALEAPGVGGGVR